MSPTHSLVERSYTNSDLRHIDREIQTAVRSQSRLEMEGKQALSDVGAHNSPSKENAHDQSGAARHGRLVYAHPGYQQQSRAVRAHGARDNQVGSSSRDPFQGRTNIACSQGHQVARLRQAPPDSVHQHTQPPQHACLCSFVSFICHIECASSAVWISSRRWPRRTSTATLQTSSPVYGILCMACEARDSNADQVMDVLDHLTPYMHIDRIKRLAEESVHAAWQYIWLLILLGLLK